MKLVRSTFVIATLAFTLLSIVPAQAAAPTWRSAENVTLPSGATSVYQGWLPYLACPTANNCSGAGIANDATGNVQGLLLSESRGIWRSSILSLPLNAAKAPGVMVYAIGCATSGNCVAGGQYLDSSSNGFAFVAKQISGTWMKASAIALPAGAIMTAQNAQVQLLETVWSLERI